MWIDISCECWHEFHGISSNISYIIRTLEWISLEFCLIAGMNFPGEFRRNFFSLLYVGWALTRISLELFNTWLLLECLYEFTGKYSTRMACCLSFEHLNCWIFIHATLTVYMNSINIMTDELNYCTACCVFASVIGVDFIRTECGVYLRRWNEMCLSCDWCVNIGCVLFHILPWYHILRGMTRVLYCIFIFVLFTLTMSRTRKITDKGRELLTRNMRGKCASSFRSGNAVINKLVPLLKDNTSSVEQVTDYITNLEHHMSSIVQSY